MFQSKQNLKQATPQNKKYKTWSELNWDFGNSDQLPSLRMHLVDNTGKQIPNAPIICQQSPEHVSCDSSLKK